LPEILEPPHALFLFDRDARRVDLLLQRVTALELLSRPRFHRRDPQRQPLQGHDQAGMQEDPTHAVKPGPTVRSFSSTIRPISHSDRLLVLPLEGTLRR